ncbi:MAG: hypothetical protein ACRC2Q_02395, partial [Cetobacterium sp.]
MDAKKSRRKKAMGLEGVVCIAILSTLIYLTSSKMGGINMINTIIKTAHDLLLNTVFFIMGVSDITGAFAGILS